MPLAALMFAAGALIAGPDAMLGGPATADACEGNPQALVSALGLVNGLGSVGTIGVSGLFMLLL